MSVIPFPVRAEHVQAIYPDQPEYVVAARDIIRVVKLIDAGRRPHPCDRRIVRLLERRGRIRRDRTLQKFVLTATGRRLADYTHL